ncbi:hypothetical protein B0T17DRAFT_519944, partial [Bombardia bombarda]
MGLGRGPNVNKCWLANLKVDPPLLICPIMDYDHSFGITDLSGCSSISCSKIARDRQYTCHKEKCLEGLAFIMRLHKCLTLPIRPMSACELDPIL